MDIQNEIIKLSINLVNSIKDNSIDQAKEVMNELKDVTTYYKGIYSLDAVPFYDLYANYPNETMNYIIDNCPVPLLGIDGLRIVKYQKEIMNSYTKEEIATLIKNETKNRTLYPLMNQTFFNELLFRLSMDINNYEIINDILPNLK